MEKYKKAGFLVFLLTLATLSNGQQTTSVASVNIEQRDLVGHLIGTDHADVRCVWVENSDASKLDYTEYTETDSIVKQISYDVVEVFEDTTVRSMALNHNGNTFNAVFWKDGSMVVYEFGDSVAILSGSIEY
jgi:hypothetical protein